MHALNPWATSAARLWSQGSLSHLPHPSPVLLLLLLFFFFFLIKSFLQQLNMAVCSDHQILAPWDSHYCPTFSFIILSYYLYNNFLCSQAIRNKGHCCLLQPHNVNIIYAGCLIPDPLCSLFLILGQLPHPSFSLTNLFSNDLDLDFQSQGHVLDPGT